ncbi:hypothetical protein QR98_0002990 [Sarcoptes scabiei]|uniref:Uncharacterized protein n=1 Tax=Sarcoptes scabiei TaxID=52283 RepID=A0A131ZT36_SARSC|nr:hypothetical protein QR98_0002990 [Sarcoptes scabiei]
MRVRSSAMRQARRLGVFLECAVVSGQA